MHREDHLEINFIKKIVSFLLFFVCIYLYIKLEINIDCIFYKITGYYCPGCGITRMFQSILEGNFYQAFRYNSFLFISINLFIIYFLISLFIPIKISNRNKLIILSCFLILLLTYGVLRNLEIFSFLSPTAL